MAKSSSNYETLNISAKTTALSDSQRRRQESTRNAEYETGRYLFIPMSHFSVDVKFNGEDFVSQRLLIFKVQDNKIQYVRSWRASHFTESLAALKEDGCPTLKPETREGMLRIPQGALTYTSSCKDRIPKSINKAGMLHIDAPFMIDYLGVIPGYTAEYTKRADGKWDVATNDEGNVKFNATNITNFRVLPEEITPALVAEAKKVLAADPQLKNIAVD